MGYQDEPAAQDVNQLGGTDYKLGVIAPVHAIQWGIAV